MAESSDLTIIITYDIINKLKIIKEKFMNKEIFIKRFAPEKLRELNGEELLMTIAAPKSSEYENSLKYVLENELIEDFGSCSAGYDTHFKLAYRNSNWHHFEESIDKDEAIKIAENIKEMLYTSCDFLNKNDFAGFYNYVNSEEISKEKLFSKGYAHKYLHIMFPKYISFFHAQKWQNYYKNKLAIKNDRLFSLEKFFVDKYDTNLDMTRESELMIKNYGIPDNRIQRIVPDEIPETKNFSLNQILYGPPGTGKTYNTVIKAMEIIAPDLLKYDKDGKVENYDSIKKEFNLLKKQGRIEFITFHQSYSYEEFVEGIKPEISEWGNNEGDEIKYTGKDGIFKQICNEAKKALYCNGPVTKNIQFNDILKVFKELHPEGSDFNTLLQLHYLENELQYKFGKQTDIRKIDLNKIEVLLENNRKYKTAVEFNQDYQGNTALKCYYFNLYKELLKIKEDLMESKISNNEYLKNENPIPYILIIDEINRGNISKIFGELITLIEDDKRENLTVTLPYSNEDFTVPKNLYIIGTMNTSDRSIASIDIALRRRFKFVEIMPKSDLVADFHIGFKTIFETLNQRISILLDRDHQIGHSYFIKDKYKDAGISTLKEIWFDSIVPLLNEYFYNDWEKLNLLIPGFIKKIEVPKELENECADKYYYEFETIENFNDDNDFENALMAQPKKNDD